ncbi:MAG: S8 family serine peptidase [Proteobacteria bacterium]|nr:S8 family serine peptidase [Pseudomonadota bacterium]MBU4297856.1 S8 family serine peptidase [Pseudomonadota bacterium]MCG2749849.1 S8 family serine peptidase [Desulfobulbaceae bacterium]
MKKILSKCLMAATVCGVVAIQGTCGAANQASAGDTFRPGEIVMAGTAAQVPGGYKIKKVLPNAGLVVLEVAKGQEARHVSLLQGKGKKCGLNLKYQAFSTPDDTYYGSQWNMRMVQSEQAWDISTGRNATVAILDTGLKTAGAEDGIGCAEILPGSDIVNSDNDPEDGAGHGTHVAGTVAQTTDNGTGVAGLAYEACVMPVKVLDDSGAGASADIAEGVAFAVAKGASVINMSLGWSAKSRVTTDPVLDPALAAAHADGVTIVCAAGNEGWSKNVSYPAISPYTIAVGAVDINGTVASYSNGGTGLDLVAPGGGNTVAGDGILQETFDDSGWNYFFYSGTSMATPHVAAAAAMLYANDPSITPEEVLTALTATAKDLGSAGYDIDYGHGLLQVYDALNAVGECLDADGDTWTTCTGDCNDSSSAVSPGAEEICGDGIDNNCNGAIDEGCEECADNDGDNWTTCAGDCNDSSSAVSPGAEEVCGDGIDNNCDSAIDEGCEACTDNDGDGWLSCEGDCDDNNYLINPGRPDPSGRWGRDGVDNDCDGLIDK